MLNTNPFFSGRSGQPVLTLKTIGGASMDIYRHGAHLTSWKTAAGREWMFLSGQADFSPGSAIRGGVPIIFPQFSGFGSGQRHGFARNVDWQLTQATSEGDSGQCIFTLQENDATLKLWPHRFTAEFTATLENNRLTMMLSIHNNDSTPFTFSAALHTYFAVGDAHTVKLTGLEGQQYWDNNGSDFHRDRFVDNQNTLRFPGAIDRVYFSCQTPLQLIDGHDRLAIQPQGFTEVVVWNPGAEATQKLQDMADAEYQNMLCVEAAIFDTPVTIGPGETWSGSQTLEQK